jgi:hypothetical protein
MEVGDIRFYTERLKALEEISTKEHRALTMDENWLKLNALYGLGKALGWEEDDRDLEIVRARWVKLKELYESGANLTAFRPPKE